jgi:cytochrome c553
MKKTLFLLVLIVFISVVQSCSHYDEVMKNPEESSAGESSHNAGENCMSCHHSSNNEASQRWWYVAGTAYKKSNSSKAEGKVELWTGPNSSGELLHTLIIDPNGNFYTERILNFKGGFYPVVVNKQNKRNEMNTKTVEGSCNSCHGISQEKIEID